MHSITGCRLPTLALALAPWLAACASPGPQGFPTPDAAAMALADAARANSERQLIELFGRQAEDLVGSGDPVADANVRARFAELYDQKHEIVVDPSTGRATIEVGPENWPFPVPLARDASGQWAFDIAVGAEEIVDRRVGRNELSTIETCRAVCDAQHDYVQMALPDKPAGDYAQRFLCSAPGRHDGLYWPAQSGEPDSPLGPLVADAQKEGYSKSKGPAAQPFHGYFYRMLTSQGPNASGGARSYVLDGHMTQGFALIAYPAEYGRSGVMSFLVSENGIVYEADLGDETEKLAAEMTAYDPDEPWMPCE
ncbi:MAG TPA: DUF2950 domain-containing protein [Planctomycetota bacterium]|nr:DUF2950 domain-containing protein [Planctomycetota bacterium]